MKRITCVVQLLTFGILLSLFAPYADAVPFDLIVPLTMTVNTYHAGGAGGVYGGWLVATSSPIVFAQDPGIANGTSEYDAVSDTPGITAFDSLLVFSNPAGLSEGNALTYPSNPATVGTNFYSAELLPSEQTTLYSLAGFEYYTSITNPPDSTGTANLTFTFAIGQDVAHYSIFVTFVDNPIQLPIVDITSAQRVSSVFDSTFATPEPGSFLTVLSGVVVLLLRRKARSATSPAQNVAR